jgi:hypothetical protein
VENRLLVTKPSVAITESLTLVAIAKSLTSKVIKLACVTMVIASVSDPSMASELQNIRFYKINKDDITQSLRFTAKKARTPGCHNFIRKARLHRVVQFQYKVCRVYSKKSCDAESLMSFYRDKEPTPATELTEGFGWYPVGDHERGEKAKSWFCE